MALARSSLKLKSIATRLLAQATDTTSSETTSNLYSTLKSNAQIMKNVFVGTSVAGFGCTFFTYIQKIQLRASEIEKNKALTAASKTQAQLHALQIDALRKNQRS